MHILLIASDLYSATGGGQTVYRGIIEQMPDCHFSYFLRDEPAQAQRPPNTSGIPLLLRRRIRVRSSQALPDYRLNALGEANQFARSVAGRYFDIVDFPDFINFGAALRTAFDHHRVTARKMIIALHGNCSTSRGMNWGANGSPQMQVSLRNERTLEHDQFSSADGAYGLSPRYIDEWQRRQSRRIHRIDPLHFVSAFRPGIAPQPPAAKPSLYCVGRSERLKGNDLFIELTRWLRRDSYSLAAHVGDEDFSRFDIGSSQILAEMARHRDLEMPFRGPMNWAQLHALYQEHSILVLPVRFDSLNLVALEALFSGCPIAVSSRAGVCDYLEKRHPGIPFVKIDFDNLYSAVGKIQDLIDRYHEHRRCLRLALTDSALPAAASFDMAACYREILDRQDHREISDMKAAEQFPAYAEWHYYYKGEVIEWGRRLLSETLPRHAYERLRTLWLAPGQVVASVLNRSGAARLTRALCDAVSMPRRLKRIAGLASRPGISGNQALAMLYGLCHSHLFRCNYYREIAQVERNLGHESIAIAYELRILRLLGSDRFHLLPGLADSLRRQGFPREAEAAIAMYANPEQAGERTYAYLQDARQRHQIRHDKAFEMLDDRRSGPCRVAVIVSLYNAASKLRFFLSALANQTLVQRGEVEIILVDSGSPDGEREVTASFLLTTPLNAVYARSAMRETIQAAWNRGIGLAAAPYLVFLGVDETLYPEALEVLADELDRNPDVDWVMANSLVTAVNEQGVLEHDIMTYERQDACKEHVYLETCYLSWVGGMYRKSIHERLGYYDESFRAAGDTEFKSRVLPYINVRFVSRMLGLFLNYPEERTTAGPLAEIEDLRAWYMHRTPAGVRYAFENRPPEVARKLLGIALGYRKSYCGHVSSDIDYASHLADYLVDKESPESWVRHVAPDLREFLQQLRQLEYREPPGSVSHAAIQLAKARRLAKRLQVRHASLAAGQGFTPCYAIHNDNRYEQHSWLWKSIP